MGEKKRFAIFDRTRKIDPQLDPGDLFRERGKRANIIHALIGLHIYMCLFVLVYLPPMFSETQLDPEIHRYTWCRSFRIMSKQQSNSPSVWNTASSVYSRCTGFIHSIAQQHSSVHVQQQHSHRMLPNVPEVNRIDNIIRRYHGVTMTLETMRSRLQAAKSQTVGPPQERQKELEKELDWHEHENQFYSTCYELYRELHAQVVDVVQRLILQSHFEPESTPAGDPFLCDAIRRLRAAVNTSQADEADTEAEWKRYWGIPNDARASAAWI